MFQRVVFLLFTLAMITVHAVETGSFLLTRTDGTLLEGYFFPPSTKDSPILVALQDASCQSVLPWYQALSKQAQELGFGVITIEKQGISAEQVDRPIYDQTNCLQGRLNDYLTCLDNLASLIPDWGGNLIFWGESEGGMLAAQLASLTSHTCAVVLIATGGGMGPREELKGAWTYRLQHQGVAVDEIDAYLDAIDEQLENIMLNPTADELFLGNTYKWWASFLSTEPIVTSLSTARFPVFLVHGTEDNCIPVLSADLAAEELEKIVTYLRLEGYGHHLPVDTVQQAAFSWLQSVLSGQSSCSEALLAVIFSQQALSESWVVDLSFYGRGKDNDRDGNRQIEVGFSGEKDNKGSGHIEGQLSMSQETERGFKFEGSISGSIGRDRDGNVEKEVKVEVHGRRNF